MHHRPDRENNCHSRAGGNPQPIGGERKVQLIMFTYLRGNYSPGIYTMAFQGIHNLHICLNIGAIHQLPLYLLGDPIEKPCKLI